LIILSHRGYWLEPSERNTRTAFERSFSLGFGTETDIRDHDCRLVISHDMADKRSLPLETFFEIYNSFNNNLPLALNIKADGLQMELTRLLTLHEIENYFVFDMAVPDGLLYARNQLNTFTRQSEYEKDPPYYDMADGVWLDEFAEHWITDEVIAQHLSNRKAVCIVSPDLHRRGSAREWDHYKSIQSRVGEGTMMLCTDLPAKAREFFNE